MRLSQRQYARHRGVSEGAVRKAIKAGRITPNADGTIDPELADRQWDANTDPAKRQRKKHKSTRKKKVPKAAFTALEETLQEHGIQASDDLYMKAKTANELIKAQIGKIELQVLKGELVDRKKAMALVFKTARAERDAWLNWPARVSAAYAAELGVDEHAFYTALSESVRRQLQRLSEGKV